MEEQAYQNFDSGYAAIFGIFALAYGIVLIILLVALWKIFDKAGKPGWAAIIPIYSCIVYLEIVGKPAWWIFLLLIPVVNVILLIIIIHRLSLSFGKDVGTTILLILLPFIGLPMLAFGNATYVGPGGNTHA